MPSTSESPNSSAVWLLRGGAITFAFVGAAMAVWGIHKWLEYPEARASQFGFEAPLWPAFTVFVVVGTGAIVGLLWTTAARIDRGKDIFSERRRRPGSDRPEPSKRER